VVYRTIHYMETITKREYGAFQRAYDFFNRELFADCRLPNVLVTLQRHANTRGYFAPDRFQGRVEQGAAAHELALNPDVFVGRSDELILSTLVHEMTHVWQQTHGSAYRKAYHNKQWAAKMKEVGLYPSSTGEVGGNEIGQQMTHYVIQDGAYARAYRKLAASGFRLNWQSQPGNTVERAKKLASKTKYTCPACGVNAWAKPDTNLICGDCYEPGEEPLVMEAV
jgi:predicted SprT family Zn-dependent metalloprotease